MLIANGRVINGSGAWVEWNTHVVAKASAEAMLQAEECLAVGCATRVGSIISIFFESRGNQRDAFPAVQAVEASWRELGGLAAETKLRHEVLPAIDILRRRALGSGSDYGRAVAFALDAAHAVATEWMSSDPRYPRVAGEAVAVAVAVEFDRYGTEPPEGYGSWTAFELAGQTALADQIFSTPDLLGRNEIFSIRVASGSAAMSYSEAFKRWIRS